MTQNYLITQLLNSSSGKNIINLILDNNPDFVATQAIEHLKSNPELKRVIDDMTESEFQALVEELGYVSSNSEMQGFKSGVDFALTLLGLDPIYKVLPEPLDSNLF